MPALKLSPLVLSIAALGLWACGGSSGTGTSTGTGGTTTGGSTSGGTSGSGSTGGADAGLPVVGTACTLGSTPDPCASAGLACTIVNTDTSCQLPGELSPCLDAPGCATTTPPLFCEPGYKLNNNPVKLCVFHCSVTADCPNVVTNCQSNSQVSSKVCFVNFCGPGAPIANGTDYYGACNSVGTGDGTCVPYNGSGSPGFCEAAGPVAAWQPCSDLRPDGGTSDLCASGSTCVIFPVPGAAPKSMCAPFCAPTGASVSGPACGAGETCFSAGSVDFGFCLTDCGGGQSCPAPTGCQGYGSQSQQECLP